MAEAAVALHVSPAAVSLGIGELERVLGAQLFLRVRHQPLTLTAARRRAAGRRLDGASLEVEDFAARSSRPCRRADRHVAHRLLHDARAARTCLGWCRRCPCGTRRSESRRRRVRSTRCRPPSCDGTCELALMYGIDLRPGIDADHVAGARPYVVVPSIIGWPDGQRSTSPISPTTRWSCSMHRPAATTHCRCCRRSG